MNEKCQKCGSRLVQWTEREYFEYKGQTVTLTTAQLKCKKCSTAIDLNAEDIPKMKKRFQLSVDGYLTDEDIKRIRKKLGLNQREMAETLGVGLKSFARYENLLGHQGKAMDNLLRILDAYPHAIKVLERQAVDEKKE